MDKIVLGIGNPGTQYANTRHNVGFMALDALATRYGVSFSTSRFQALVAEVREGQSQILLVKPMTYVNLSGGCAKSILSWYKLETSSLLVIVDDLALPLGKIRIRHKGSSGGHRGMDSIINCLGTDEFLRIRVGIGDNPNLSHVEYVLSQFLKEENLIIQESISYVMQTILDWCTNGVDICDKSISPSTKNGD